MTMSSECIVYYVRENSPKPFRPSVLKLARRRRARGGFFGATVGAIGGVSGSARTGAGANKRAGLVGGCSCSSRLWTDGAVGFGVAVGWTMMGGVGCTGAGTDGCEH